MIIRKAKLSDAKDLARLYVEFWAVHKNTNPLFQPDFKITYENCFKDAIVTIKSKKYATFFAIEGKEISGYTTLMIKKKDDFYKVKTEGHIEEVTVFKKYRRQGIARKLVEFGLDYFRKKGIKYVSLDVVMKNKIALDAWKKLKFKEQAICLVREIR